TAIDVDDGTGGDGGGEGRGDSREVLAADLHLYGPDGALVGGVSGFAVKQATRASLLSAVEEVSDLLHEIAWHDRPLSGGVLSASFLAAPAAEFSRDYLDGEGVEAESVGLFLADLERLSRLYALAALQELGWERKAGSSVQPAGVRRELKVVVEHERLLGRLFAMLADAGIVVEDGAGHWVVAVGQEDPLPDDSQTDPGRLAERVAENHPYGLHEIGLLTRCGSELANVLRGRTDPLPLLFASDGPSAADLYREAPLMRVVNRIVGDVVAAAVADLPAGRRLRVLEVGAGTGGTTSAILPILPAGRFDYFYTDVTAGFFAGAEDRFGGSGAPIDFRVLDIERDPAGQGFYPHGYDLVIAANVLHATRDLGETLTHCRDLLAPSGQLVALEGLRGQGWMDLTFGLLEGWWRFKDKYRADHALASESVWRQALADAGFGEVAVLHADPPGDDHQSAQGVIVARGPVDVVEPPGVWVVAGVGSSEAAELSVQLAERNQTVVLAGQGDEVSGVPPEHPVILAAQADPALRETWRSLLEGLPSELPLRGVVHLAALHGHGASASVEELAEDTARAGASALALTQALADTNVAPSNGLWFVTRGAQILDRECAGELAGTTLWGIGKTAALEAAHLQPRMIDLDPRETTLPDALLEEMLHPDRETHIAYRAGQRQAMRLVRWPSGSPRATIPEEPQWRLVRDPGGQLEELKAERFEPSVPGPGEIRVAVAAAGLNFHDVLLAMGVFDEDTPLGGEMCGRVVATGTGVTGVGVGDRVAGFALGAFGPEAAALEELVAPAPPAIRSAELATVPVTFVTAALALEMAGLEAGQRVLVHAAAGGVGQAAIQLARLAGAEVFATASAAKRAYLRALGVEHVFDSRSTTFAEELLEVTGGHGVDVVLNSLTGEGFVEASLSCLGPQGRFVEIGKRNVWSAERVATARPDVDYHVLALDQLLEEESARVGVVLRSVMARLSTGELEPIPYTAWPIAEAGKAMAFMQSGRHVGKLVLTMPPLARGRLRDDGTYLVTGGLGGLGRAIAGWLADSGAGAIVLNGRRAPDADAEAEIAELRRRVADLRIEVADVTDAGAVDGMLARIDRELPPLAGVIHSVGSLSDASLVNQSWERFERVLWPKMLGAWHLHLATVQRDLDLFVLFSSMTGVLGNAGQANHAAANAFLDQLARHRRSMGLAGQSIAWGAWSGLGAAEEQRSRIVERLAAAGVGWIAPRQGLQALDRLVRQDVATGAVASVTA
ncbi:MAG: SDR family NAD(P)-dependent oxidoreductase, partial [Chloroflexi bacterium]|nr:SDR family NAD(P)-dependent oxidoreductase [Chloroflexota bacterium]